MKWKAQLTKHRGESRITVYFEKNIDLIARIKQLEGSRWSQSLGVWHLPDTVENRIRFKIPQSEGKSALSHIHESNQLILKRFIEEIQLIRLQYCDLKNLPKRIWNIFELPKRNSSQHMQGRRYPKLCFVLHQ